MTPVGYSHSNSDSGGLNVSEEGQGKTQGGQTSKNVKGIGDLEVLPREGGSGPLSASRLSQVSRFVRDFETWAQFGRGPRDCSTP